MGEDAGAAAEEGQREREAVRAILGNEDVNTKCDPGRSRKKQKKEHPPEKAGENRVKNQMPNQSIPGATTDAKPLKRSRKM